MADYAAIQTDRLPDSEFACVSSVIIAVVISSCVTLAFVVGRAKIWLRVCVCVAVSKRARTHARVCRGYGAELPFSGAMDASSRL